MSEYERRVNEERRRLGLPPLRPLPTGPSAEPIRHVGVKDFEAQVALLELYKRNLREAEIDEINAGPLYRTMAGFAEKLALSYHASQLKRIAEDEDRHRKLIRDMLEGIEVGRK